MNRRYKVLICLSVLLVFASCSNEKSQDQSVNNTIEYVDGTYSATATEVGKAGYRDEVHIEVKDRHIVSVEYNGFTEYGHDKKSESHGGAYDMTIAGAKKPWHEQAELLQNSLIQTQDPETITLDSEGYTDAVAGVSIKAKSFVDLSKTALSDAKY